jgi:pyruvate-ferredoxin/flavodoxin oxidoreductase
VEFSGACAGCGETPYIKLMTQLFGSTMYLANATGCTQAWGASPPSVPYTVNYRGQGPSWGNSLFENNAEYALGMALAARQQREQILLRAKRLSETAEGECAAALRDWMDNYDNLEGGQERADRLVAALKGISGDDAAFIRRNSEHITKKSIWMYGGDGWAYDIGFGGLDHVLNTGEKVNILVVDTEVYSNTGGQSSKATPIGATALFAAAGKSRSKKDLGAIVMTYGNVYVAQVAMGADFNQLITVLKEAQNYPGPALIIAYAPCITHGIVKGMGYAQEESKLAVQSGYWHLYRYNPQLKLEGKNPFILDSKEPTLPLRDFLMGEVRFAALSRKFPERAEYLMGLAEEQAKEKFERYSKLAREF